MQRPIPPLDRTDREILAALQEDARITNKELAARVHLAPSSCHARVRRLTEEGVLRGFHADADPRALGIGLQTIVLVRLADHAEKKTAAVLGFVRAIPEVVDTFLVAGKDDLLLHVAVRDTEHLREVVLETIGAHPDVADVHTSLVYEHFRKGLPDLG